MATTARYPSAALADFGADTANIKTAVLSGAHNGSVTTITLTATVPAEWPTAGWVTIDGEIIAYTGKSGATLTTCTRGAQSTYGGGAAAAHNDASIVAPYLTAQQVNQIVAELIAHQSAIQAQSPNLVLNSDFGRRTVFGLAMPEAFADTSGFTVIDGSIGTVTANVLTAGTNGTWSVKWCGTNATFYRDGRFSFLVKQNGTGTTNVGRIGGGKGDGVGAWTANNGVYAVYFRTGASTVTLELIKVIAGATTVVASSAGLTFTDGNVGWVELEGQGTTYIAKLYTQGSGTPGVKSSATLLATVSGTVADAGVTSGQPMAVNGSGVGAATVWGGVSTGNGGVYVETWLPESWAITHTGTLGGQAVAYDDVADSGPLNKQWTPVVYIPAVSRTMTVQFSGPDGGMQASTAYAFSYYEKNTSLGGSGVMIRGNVLEQNSASATQATNSQDDAAETSFTRKTATFTTNAATRRLAFQFLINQGGARTGIVRFSLPQVELGSAATAWRNASADDAPITYRLSTSRTLTNAAALADMEPRDLFANIFAPWDATISMRASFPLVHTSATGRVDISYLIDAVGQATSSYVPGVTNVQSATAERMATVAAGKHRVGPQWNTSAATATSDAAFESVQFYITLYRGK